MSIKSWNRLWDKWDLRGVIILSLALQALLILSAPLRKRTNRGFVLFPLWLAYLLADTVAIFAIGLISKSRLCPTVDLSVDNENLLTFWAPFLLVHLGGPDTITAFALEDNQLWLRHLLQLLSQSVTAAYVFFLSLSNSDLWLPTLLMFVAGLIKYSERTRSLYLASSRRFRESLLTEPDPGPNYAKLMDEYFSKKSANLPTYIKFTGEPVSKPKTADQPDTKALEDIDVIKNAHRFFETFKGLIADLIFSFRERNQSREFFLNRNPKNAFKVVEVELNFFYEILYSKILVIQGRIGYCLRFISFSSFVASFVVFDSKEKKKLHPTDIRITYALFIGGIALDILAFLMLILSDWTAIALTKSKDPSLIIKFLQKLLCVKRQRWVENTSEPYPFRLKLVLPLLRRRWSECISQYNLIDYCLRPRSKNKEKFIDLLGLTNILDELKYVGRERFHARLRNFIFNELRLKSEMAEDLETAKEICLARGDWVLRTEGCSELLPYVLEVNYDESLILWHIATELLYSTDKAEHENESRKNAKLLSDYMLYLLIMQQTMLSPVAGIGEIRFRDTCAEAKIFFQRRKIGEKERDKGRKESSVNPRSCANIFRCFNKCCCEEKGLDEHERACKTILDVKTEAKPIQVKGDRSKSVLFDGSILAKELMKLGEKEGDKRDKWKIISKVWVELLSYGACNCRPTAHAAQLSKGGQLITHVWLLMAHLGLGEQFQINEGHARAKLIVEK
ncbi:uncharacterized protein LOC127795811 [Diospyros lotus]|uniref:uncharacterized protein LOC127795811 n=1 Tax=Diospyros lotus TaxID=55363 RepID=UPI0022524C51|nr:uncharacterized protein LOC127795811 [Diospyros lotus]